MVDFVIDGSNVLLGLRIQRSPSVRAFSRMLGALEARGHSYQVWFDNSIRTHLAAHPEQLEQFEHLCASLNEAGVLNFAPHADPCIQRACQAYQCPVVNYSDNNTSWAYHPPIYRCRLTRNKTGVYVSPAGARSVRGRLIDVELNDKFTIFEKDYAATEARPIEGEELVVRLPRYPRHPKEGSVVVLALDASPSMDETDTFDGSTRADHVNRILTASLLGLRESTITKGLFASVLAFSGDVTVIRPDADEALFHSIVDWGLWADNRSSSYLAGVTRDQTNIRLALDRASDLIDRFRHSDEAPKLARSWAKATVVLLTDGEHFLNIETEQEEADRIETSQDILGHVFNTLQRSEDVQFAFVGIGEDADDESMLAWASVATDKQRVYAANCVPPVNLVNNRLFVKADARDANFDKIVRSFIDLASSTASVGA